MLKTILLSTSLYMVACFAGASETTPDNRASNSQNNVIGKTFSIDSQVLSEARDIQIYLPSDYQSSDKRYPVLYILDGQRLFLHGVSLQQTFTSNFQLSPDFIVVGINNSYPHRFRQFSGTKFLDFIEQELLPHVDKHYRTSNERLFYGWEYGGAFVIETMLSRPKLFNAHIAASPFPLDVKNTNQQSRIDRLTTKLNTLDSFLYFSVSKNEQGVIEGTQALDSLLQQRKPANLNWHYRVINGEEHRSTAHATLYQALRSYFKFYPRLAINTLDEYNHLGGMDYIAKYNKARAKQFGFDDELHSWTMYALVRAAMRDDNFKQFAWFMNEFAQYQFVEKVQFRRTFEIANFYLKYQKPGKAITLYHQLLKREPDSARMQNALGDIYATQKDKQNATKHYQRAVKLATVQKDANLAEYQADLNRL